MDQASAKDRLRPMLDHFARVGDPREACKVKHPLGEVLFRVTCVSIAGCDDDDEIADWGVDHLDFLKGYGELFFGTPMEDCCAWCSTGSTRRCSTPVSRPGLELCGAEQVAQAIRCHGGVESRHRVLDVIVKEDQSRLRPGYGAARMALVRRLAFDLVRAGKGKRAIKAARKAAGWKTENLAALINPRPR